MMVSVALAGRGVEWDKGKRTVGRCQPSNGRPCAGALHVRFGGWKGDAFRSVLMIKSAK